MIRKHLRSNIIGYVALFVALTGTAYAANTIGSADIINGEVKSVDVGNGEVVTQDIANAGVEDQDLADDSVDGGAIEGSAVRTSEIANDQVRSADVLDDSLAGDDIADGAVGSAELATATAASVFNLASETIATNLNTTLHADTETFDTANLHDPATNESLVAPVAGIYVVAATVDWDASSVGTRRTTIMAGLGTQVALEFSPPLTAPSPTVQNVSGIAKLAAGQEVHVVAAQTSGADLDARLTRFSITFVGPT